MPKFIFMKTKTLCLLLLSISCWSQSPIQCDRPDQTETPYTVPKGRIQSENGFSIKQDVDHRNYSIPSSLWKYGLTERWELRLIAEWNVENYGSETLLGIQPLQVGAKVNFCTEKNWRPRISLIAHVALPDCASPDFKGRFYAPNFRFTLQHSLTDRLSLGYNFGAHWHPVDGKRTGLYTATLGYSLSEKWGCYGEIFGFAPQNEAANHSIDGGFTYLISPDFMLDLSAGKRIAGETAKFYTAFGISFRI